jgi:hypothetical protein
MKGEAKNIDAGERNRRRDMAERLGKEDFIQRSSSRHQQTHPGVLQEMDAGPHVSWPAQQVNPFAHRKSTRKASTRRASSAAPCLHPIIKLYDKTPSMPHPLTSNLFLGQG